MDIYDFLTESIQTEYTTVKVLKDSWRSRITLVRHKETGKPFVFRQFTGDAAVCRRLIQVDCSHLPRIYEVGEKDGRVAVLEEYIQGDNLAELLESGLFSEKETRKIAVDILEGLQVLHSLGAVHRDIKPENVLLRETGAVLIDFDASRVYKEAQASDTHILGTTGYAAPEQFGVTQTDHRADIYAMGILMNIMLTGKHPSKAMATGRMGKIISRCTMMDPGKRYRNVDQLLRALERKPHQVVIPTVLCLLLMGALALIPIRPRTAPEPPAESPLASAAVPADPSPEKLAEPSPAPTPVPSPTPEAPSLSAEATYADQDGTYRLFLCFDAGMISRHIAQPDRQVELPPDVRTGCPSILTVYKEGSSEDVREEFSAKLHDFSVKALPSGDGSPMELIDAEVTPEFAGALHMVSISMWTQNKENVIQWTLNMADGQEITLAQKLTVVEADSVVITPDNTDMSTLDKLQQVIDYIGNDAGPGATIDIYLPPVTYEGDLTIRYRGVNLYGDPAGTTLKGSITVEVPISERIILQDLALEGQGGSGVAAHAPVGLVNCSLSGYDIAAAAYDGGWVSAYMCHIHNNGIGLHLNSAMSGHTDVGYANDVFENNDVAIEILAVDSEATMIFPDSVFSGNGQDIDNQIDYPVDVSEALFQ